MDKFSITCRTCNTERSNLVNLSSCAPGNDALKLRDVLLTVCPTLPIQDNDRLPQRICYFCSKQLEIAYKFQLQCKKSYEELQQIIEVTIKEELASAEPECSNNHEDDGDNLYLEDDFQDGLPQNLEFLDEDEMEEDNTYEIQSEELPEIEEHHRETLHVEPVPSAEDDAPVMCCHCDKRFFTTNGLRLHEKLSHKNLKPVLIKAEILTIECKYCLQVFEKESELTLHCNMEHRNKSSNEFTCNVCHKTFSGKNRFQHHLLYHGKSRYQCLVKDCSRSFVIRYKLADHMKRFHGIILSSSEVKTLKPNITEEKQSK